MIAWPGVAAAAGLTDRVPLAIEPAAGVEHRSGKGEFTRGLFMMMKGDFWGAIDSLRRSAPTNDADAAAVHYALSRAFTGLAIPDSAKVHGEAALRIDPGNSHYTRYLARISHDMRNYGRAAELYGQAAALDGGRPDLLYMQALEYISANRMEEALSVLKTMIARDPLNETALSQAVWLEIGLKRFPEAIESLNLLIGLGREGERLRLTLGELYLETGQQVRAVETFNSIVEANRNYVPAWVALFDYHIRSGSPDAFGRELMRFSRSASIRPETMMEIAGLYIIRSSREPRYAEPARMVLDVVAAGHPRDVRVAILKGQYAMIQGDSGSAVASFRDAVRIDSASVPAWESLVLAYMERRETMNAFAAIRQARRRLPRERLRLDTLDGHLLLQSGHPERAVQLLERTVRRAPDIRDEELLIEANTTLALAYDAAGRRSSCIDTYQTVLELDPHNTLAMNNLAYLLADKGEMLDKALKLATNAVLLDPENGVYLDTLGWVRYRTGDYNGARQALEKALSTGIDEAEVYSHLGDVYERLGESGRAKEMREKARMKGN